MSQRGAIVGLDLGMTNSLLTYFDEVSGLVTYTGRSGDAFAIPTVVEFKLKPATDAHEPTRLERLAASLHETLATVGKSLLGFAKITIGRAALWGADSRRNFKSRLAPAARLSEIERDGNEAYRATKAFLKCLFDDFLDDYAKSSGVRTISSIVVTVPEAWVRGDELGGVEALRQIFAELDLPTPIFLSEPVAAACYFAFLNSRKTGAEFKGHVLIYDHGGSTLDISIASIDGPRIQEVSNYGSGLRGSDEGFGGVYFDQLVLAQLAERSGTERLKKLRDAEAESPDRIRWLAALEVLKRDRAAVIEAVCNGAPDECLGSIGDTEILASDFIEVFDAHFSAKVRSALQGVINRALFRVHFEMADAQRFRVICVGGFSEFPPLQKLIRAYFLESLGGEGGLVSHFGLNDRWQAVSKGACLVAAEKVVVDYRCPFTFGFIAYVGVEPLNNDLLVFGQPQSDYATETFGGRVFGSGHEKDRHRLEFYIESGGRRRIMRMQDRLSDILPDINVSGNRWRACGVIRNGAVEVHFKSEQTGKRSSVRVGKLMTMIDGPVEVKHLTGK